MSKKKAKMGHTKFGGKEQSSIESSVIMISGNHLVQSLTHLRSRCGVKVSGWRYVERHLLAGMSICPTCIEEDVK